MVAVVTVIAACSTKKNTSQTRWWHSFNAKYNTYYNGAVAYINGSLEKENGNKDNYTEMIPLYTVSNKQSRELGKGNFDRAIEKSKKAIQQHSIKKRPEWNKSRKKTEKDLEWLSRREYNPFLWKAWMLMGRSQFHQGAFDEAAATFSYMSRLYQTQPAIYGKARAWLAKCYVEQDWLYDAEDIIRNMQRDSIDWRAQKEWDYTLADYYIHTADFQQAVPYLRKVIRHEMRRKQKAREWFLMGQVQAALGNKAEAYKAFKHVIRMNPPYELEFNARIAMTEVMAAGKSKQMVSRLKRMAANDNNKDYLDQVYYAMGNIYLADKDTLKAISAYEKGNEKATRSGIEKGVLLLHLGDLYWQLEKYSDARRCYGEAIGLLDKDRKDYQQLSDRSKVLDELVPHTEAVHLQDSLQELAKMSEADRNAAIDRVIDALKKKEKEEKAKQAEAEAAQRQAEYGGNTATNTQQPTPTTQQNNGLWYFYNPTAVSQGKATFQKQWGRRENTDDWQRANKTVVGGIGSNSEFDLESLTDEQRDSIAAAEQLQDSLEQVADSAQNDPHKREYYLVQIPFTPEQLEASNILLEAGLHHAGVIFKDRLDNLPLSEKHLRRVADDYPDYEQMDDVYYHLFLLYNRLGQPTVADGYVAMLKDSFPESQWTTLLSDPNFVENSKFGVHIEDSLYAATYAAFKADRYDEVAANSRLSENRFPLGANRDKFLFIGGLSKLNNGDVEGCVSDMKTVVEKFPRSRISEMAGMIVNGVNAGRRLHGGKFDLNDVWSRRSAVLNDSDSIQAQGFSPDRLADFNVLLLYQPDSLQENKLLFEMARFNFTNFLVREFDLTIDDLGSHHQMRVGGFRSYDEAYQYVRQLAERAALMQQAANAKIIIISQPNLDLIGTRFGYQDYDDFYAEHFAPLRVTTRYLLSEPAEVATPRERDLQEEIESKAPTLNDLDAMQEAEEYGETFEDTEATDDFVSPEVTESPVDSESSDTLEETVVPTEAEVPMEPEAPTTPSQDDFILPTEEPTTPPQDDFILPTEEPTTPPQDDSIFPTEENPAAPQPAAPAPQQKPALQQPSPQQQAVITPAPQQPLPSGSVIGGFPADVPSSVQQPQQPADPDIYFDDAPPAPASTTPSGNQPQGFDIEDEYYDLDGF